MRDQIATVSSLGDEIDVVAPGEFIQSTNKGGGWKVGTGTSYATPHVTGTIALMLARNPNLSELPDITTNIVRKKLKKTTKILEGYTPSEQGAGLVQAPDAVFNGDEKQTGWKEIDGYKYYFKEGGTKQTGWLTIENDKYWFD